MDEIKVWASMAFKDAEKQMAWLSAIGFREKATYRDDDGTVVHAEWLWADGGGIMFGQQRADGGVDNAGGSAVYLVTDDPDAVFARRFGAATAAGRTSVTGAPSSRNAAGSIGNTRRRPCRSSSVTASLFSPLSTARPTATTAPQNAPSAVSTTRSVSAATSGTCRRRRSGWARTSSA